MWLLRWLLLLLLLLHFVWRLHRAGCRENDDGEDYDGDDDESLEKERKQFPRQNARGLMCTNSLLV